MDESCNPYKGQDESCIKEKKCHRWYSDGKHKYVGGYYGACSEEVMISALNANGPLSVSFEVYADFMHYKSGVYHHTGVKGLEPFIVSLFLNEYFFNLTRFFSPFIIIIIILFLFFFRW